MVRTLIAMTALLGAACTAPKAPPVPAPAATPTATSLDEAHVACVASTCPSPFPDCGDTLCAPSEATWSVTPLAIHHTPFDGLLSLSVQATYTPAHAGEVAVPRVDPVWMGATAITSRGEEIDLAVQTIFPEADQGLIQLLAEVGPDVHAVIVGLWGQQITPCDSARSGCRDYGFLLDEPLASYPPRFYTDGAVQRLLPQELIVQPVLATAHAAQAFTTLDLARAELQRQAAPFGSAITFLPPVLATTALPSSRLAQTSGADLPLVTSVAEALDLTLGPPPVAVPPGADLLLTVGGGGDMACYSTCEPTAPDFAWCATTQCAD